MHASAEISAQPVALMQYTVPLCKEELLLELGNTDELDGTAEPLLGFSLPLELDGSLPVSTLDDEPSAVFPM
jgi:hypothetical protein